MEIQFPDESSILAQLPDSSDPFEITFPQAIGAASVNITVLTTHAAGSAPRFVDLIVQGIQNHANFENGQSSKDDENSIARQGRMGNWNNGNGNGGTAHKCKMTTTTNASTATAMDLRELITNNIYRSPRQGKEVI